MAWNSKERSIGRVGTSMDVGRAAAAVRGPGIDTRTWFSLAIINAMTVTSEGAFAQVTLHPSGDVHNARCGGSELWEPLNIDDEVVVAWPSGDPMEGLVVVRRLGSAADPPDKRVVNAPGDWWTITKPKVNAHLIAGAALELRAEGSGQDATLDADGNVVLQGGTLDVARKTDSTSTGTLTMAVATAGPLTVATFTWIDEKGTPTIIGAIGLTTVGGTITPGNPAALVGQITNGNAKIQG